MKKRCLILGMSLSLMLAGCSAAPMATMSDLISGGSQDTPSQLRLTPETELREEKQDLTKDNTFKEYEVNPFVNPAEDQLSTFAMDVDTASYTWMRKSIQNNLLPEEASVRIEEYINFFDYQYTKPTSEKFEIHTDIAPSPFAKKETHLMRVGLQGLNIGNEDRKKANLTFVIDVSGSMSSDNRLGLVKKSLALLTKQLTSRDKVAIVVYGSNARKVLDPTSNKDTIIRAINELGIEGATNAEAGLVMGYELASTHFEQGAINRVILCSDGVANVGNTGPDAILKTIKSRSEVGITLSTIGFGMGNFNDHLMEQLANNGDGNFAYVDTLKEAERIFVENLSGTLQVIAKDAKIQVDFNPEVVKEYRLLGYENREVADKDFRNDSVDGGEVGSNHSVTALYELKLKADATSGDIATVNIRYKDIDDLNRAKELAKKVNVEDIQNDLMESSPSFQLAASVAEYAEILRNSKFSTGDINEPLNLVKNALKGYEKDEKVTELVKLMNKAATLTR